MTSQPLTLLAETLPLTVTDQGTGRPYLLLHGGAGPHSMAGLAGALAPTGRTLVPTHPKFEGQPRPEWFRSIADLATAYLALLERLDLHEVVVVGNSVGGWLAAKIGLRASPRVAALVLLNAVGLDPTPASGPIADLFALPPAEQAAHIFHDPTPFARALVPASPEAAAVLAANQQALRVYGGEHVTYDPRLRTRLPHLRVPTLVLWGESDRIVTPAYGQQFADLIPHAQFALLPQAGHLPQLERLADVVAHLHDFCQTLA